tara:strand:+ start:327 stop:1313 length:987 start_codon:yes stop_codon:yes gene_type:complete
MNLPLITIGIATYNSFGTVERSIYSALSQDWYPLEILVVDDCSKDNTLNLLKKLEEKHKEISVIQNSQNMGIGFVRNQIICEAKGEFLAFFDDDDISKNNRLKSQYQRIINYEKKEKTFVPVICHTNRKVIYPNGIIRIQSTMGTKLDSNIPKGIEVAKRILIGTHLSNGYGSCPTCSQMARLSTYKIVSGFDSKFRRGEDTDLIIRLAINGTHFIGIQEALVEQTMTNSSDKGVDIDFKYMFLLLKKHKTFIKKYGNYNFCFHWLIIKYLFSKRMHFKATVKLIVLLIKYPKETIKRFTLSLQNLQINNDFALFHKESNKKKNNMVT